MRGSLRKPLVRDVADDDCCAETDQGGAAVRWVGELGDGADQICNGGAGLRGNASHVRGDAVVSIG